MNGESPHIYRFDDFQLDTGGHALYHRESMVEDGGKKMLQVLAVFLRSPKRIVTHDEVINEVWGNGNFDVTSDNVNQYVSQIRRVLARCEPDREYFINKKGRGYIFTGEVDVVGKNSHPRLDQPALPDDTSVVQSPVIETTKINSHDRSPLKILALSGAAVVIAAAAFAYWNWARDSDEDKIRQVIKDSQIFESLILYKDPTLFKEEDMDKYWTSDINVNLNDADLNLNYDRRRIRDAVKKMAAEGRHYGDESKYEQFEFQSVEVNRNRNEALAKTLEKWFIADYQSNGTLLKNKYVGPYFVSYVLKKINGRWLIEKSNTARTSRPIPRLGDIEAQSELKSGQQVFVNISGQDIEPETVFLEVMGPGCLDSRPCRIPNVVLRENSKMSHGTLEHVPLTLTSGNFRIVAHNGDSPPSNEAYLTIP